MPAALSQIWKFSTTVRFVSSCFLNLYLCHSYFVLSNQQWSNWHSVICLLPELMHSYKPIGPARVYHYYKASATEDIERKLHALSQAILPSSNQVSRAISSMTATKVNAQRVNC